MLLSQNLFAAIMQFHETQSSDLEPNTRMIQVLTMNEMPLRCPSVGNHILLEDFRFVLNVKDESDHCE